MPQVRYNPELSLGNIVTVLTIIVGLAAGWQNVKGDVSKNASDIAGLQTKVSTLETKVEGIDKNTNDEKVKLASLLTQLQTDVQYLRVAVDELKKMRGNK